MGGLIHDDVVMIYPNVALSTTVSCSAFTWACVTNNLPTAKWLSANMDITVDDVAAEQYRALVMAMERGHKYVARWLYDKYPIPNDIAVHGFEQACVKGMVNVMRWMPEAFRFEHVHISRGFVSAYCAGHGKKARGLYKRTIFARESRLDVLNATTSVMKRAIRRKRKAVRRGHLDEADVQERIATRAGAARQWLCSQEGVIRDEAANNVTV